MSAVPTHLDRYLDEPCPRCQRAYLWGATRRAGGWE